MVVSLILAVLHLALNPIVGTGQTLTVGLRIVRCGALGYGKHPVLLLMLWRTSLFKKIRSAASKRKDT
jgi:hypothetical protein